MSALHIPSGGNAQTAANSFAGTGTTNWSASFFLRVNESPLASLIAPLSTMFNAFFTAGGATNIQINPTVPALYISFQCSSGFLFWQQDYTLGQIFHVAFAYDAVNTSSIYIGAVPVVSQSAMGVSNIGGTHASGFAPYADGDLSVGGFGMWGSHTLTQSEVTALASGVSPLAIATPADGYCTLAGTSGTAAHAGDTGLLNTGGGGSSYSIASVSANYSSDTLAVDPIVNCPEAFVCNRSGSLILFWLASTFTRFSIVNDNGFYDRELLFINMKDGGSDYTNPTATLSGGSPSTPAVLGPPIVVDGQIVGVPIWNPGDGFAATGLTISFSDSTGSGAVGVPVVGGQLLPVTSVGSPPTVNVNGSPATLNPLDSFESLFHSPFVAYQFQTPVASGQAVTYTLPADWASSYLGSAAASASNAVANNYAGAAHEPRFVLPPSVNLKMGFNHVSGPMTNFSSCCVGQDISKRFNSGGAPMTSWADKTVGIGSWVIGGNATELPVPAGPTVVFVGDGTSAVAACMIAGGVIQSVPMVSSSSDWTHATVFFTGGGGGGGAAGTATISGGQITGVILSSGGQGYCDGIYTLQWDDTAPIGSGPYTPTTDIVLADNSFGGPFVILTPIASLSSAGTLVSGVLEGITIAYYVQYRPGAAYSYDAAIGMTFTGGSGTGPYANTAYDSGGNPTWICTPPQNTPNRSNPVEPDNAIKSLCHFSAGNNIGTIRYMDCTLPSGGVSNARNPLDVTQLSDVSYNQNIQFPTATVAAIRPYSHSVSKFLYIDTNSPGSTFTSGGQPTAYAIPIGSDGWLNPFDSPTSIVMEFVTSSPHGFGSYQEYNSGIVSPNYIAVTNGQVGGMQNPPTTANLPGYPSSMYSTGTNSFMATYGSLASTGTTMPGGVNNAACTQGVTGGIVNNSVGALTVGSPGSSYAAGTTVPVIAAPAGAWLTALATATTSAGSVNTISPVSGHAGNNYALAPLVTIQPPPGGSYAAATVAFDLVGGVVSNLTLTYSGIGYPSTGVNIPFTFWGGGSGSGASGFATTGSIPVPGGSPYIGIVSVTLTSGGSSYTYPLRVIVPPPSAVATAHSTISGGSVTGYVLDSGGSTYPSGFVPWVLVDAPAQQAIISPTLTAGSLSALGIAYGGSGHVVPPELVILGTGTGALASTVISSGVVTGIIGLAVGSNYTGTNPISVGVAPPARQAVGMLSVSGGAIQSGSIVDPGCGYPNTPSSVSVVGAGTGGAMTATMVFPFDINVPADSKAAGNIPYEVAAGFNASLSGSGCWVNIPMAATTSLATSIVTSVATYLPAGQSLWLEFVNEHWNDGFPFGNYLTTTGFQVAGSLGTSNGDQFYYRDALYVAFAANMNSLAETYLTSVGRPNDLVRVFGSMGGNSQRTANMVAYANQTSTRIDAVAIGPYWTITDDTCLQYAFASIIADLPQSIANGTAWQTDWPWTMDMAHDLLRNLIISDAAYVGTGTGGSPLGYFAAHNNALAAYNLAPGQTSRPMLVAYEAAISQHVPDGIAPGYALVVNDRPYDATAMLELDLLLHPGMYDTGMAFFKMQDDGGLSVSNYFQVQNEIFDPNLAGFQNQWTVITFEGQQPGMGDGSDGRAVNIYWKDSNTIPGAGSTAAAYTTFFHRYNCSPLMQAFRDFGALSGSPTPTPTLSVTPTSATVLAGATRSITATLANSSAALSAAALHGTVSTATPTSGTPFTYTAPTSGFSSDTVTVTDSDDSLTAPVAITISLTPTPTPSVRNTAFFGGRAYGTVAYNSSTLKPLPTPRPRPPVAGATIKNTAYFGGRAYGTVAYGGSSIIPLPSINPGRFHSVLSTAVLPARVSSNTAYFGGRAYGTVAYGGSSGMLPPIGAGGSFTSVLIG